MRSTCFLLSRISSRTSIILVRRSFTSCLSSFFLTSVSFFLPSSSASSASQSLANLRMRSICLLICSILFSSLWASCCGWPSPSAPSSATSASASPSPWASSGASLMTSRTRSLPFLSLVPMSRISTMATRQARSARSTSFSPSSMRLAISTSPSRVRRLTLPILRR